jgi:hypothetical protein
MAPPRLSRVIAILAVLNSARGLISGYSTHHCRSFALMATADGDSSEEALPPPPAASPPYLSKLYTLSPSELRAKVEAGMKEAARLRKAGAEFYPGTADAAAGSDEVGASSVGAAARDLAVGAAPGEPEALLKLHGALRSMDQLQPRALAETEPMTSRVASSPGDEGVWGAEVAAFRARAAQAQAVREASGLAAAAAAAKAATTSTDGPTAARFFAGYSDEELSGLWSVHAGVVEPAESGAAAGGSEEKGD